MGLQFYIITHFITGAISFVTGFAVFLKDRKKILNITYFFLAFSVAIWSFSYSIWLLQKDALSALFWARTLNFGSSLIPVFYLHWILSLLNLKRKKLLIFFYVFTFIFLMFGYSSSFIYGTKSILQFPYFPQANWLYILWLVLGWGGVIVYTFRLLIIEINRTQGNYRTQLNYVLIGSAIGFLGGTTNHFLMLGLDWFPPFGSPLAGLYPLVFAYAMIKHRLMDIKFVLRQYSVSLISFLIIAIPATYVIQFYEKLVPSYKTVINFTILFLAIYFFPICRDYFYRIANKYFFSSLYDSAQVIAKLSDKLRSTLYLEKVYEYIFESLNNAFHLKAFGIMSFDEKKGTYYVRYNKGFEIGSLTEYEAVPVLEKMFIKQNKPIVVDEIKVDNHDSKAKKLLNFLKKTGVAILMPLNVKDKTVGLLALGEKESGDIFNSEDYKVLDVVSAQSAIAIENAMLYDESQKFTIKLEKEVEKATKELKDANEKLKKLDESKSEFISIASHQLRTPLTVVKGYVSMILEGSFGKISATQRDSLDKVYQSNERLIHLVENLLNLSRIESGRLQFKYETMNLETVVDSVFEELTSKAKEKKLKFEYKKPAKPLPKVVIDQEKIRQVIMNLIDNSIKYTAKGSVTVSVKKEADNIEFCVSDTGMGVDPDDIPHLFQKFQRGTGTFLVHTEGTGLGLYVAREMIEQHKGKIWVESKGKNKGSKFIFTIPINNV